MFYFPYFEIIFSNFEKHNPLTMVLHKTHPLLGRFRKRPFFQVFIAQNHRTRCSVHKTFLCNSGGENIILFSLT